MRARFVSNFLLVTLGGVLVAVSLAMTPAAAGWVAFGIGCAALVITFVACPAGGRGAAQRRLDVMTATSGSGGGAR